MPNGAGEHGEAHAGREQHVRVLVHREGLSSSLVQVIKGGIRVHTEGELGANVLDDTDNDAWMVRLVGGPKGC
eukprot:1432618-Alexandrium_andersonii.AAC.1